MGIRAVIDILRAEGFLAEAYIVRRIIQRGQIPRPPFDSQLRYEFSEEHIEALRRCFMRVIRRRRPKRGKRIAAEAA